MLLVPFAGGRRVDLQLRTDDVPDRFDGPDVRVGRARPPGSTDVGLTTFLQVVGRQRARSASGEADALGPTPGYTTRRQRLLPSAAALSGDAAAVGRFAADRRNAALYNRDAAGLALDHMLASGGVTRWKRRLAARAAMLGHRRGSWLDSSPFGPRAAARKSDAIY